ncbi:MAG: polysaccharide deacetylase family protein [Phycisphaerae bacterium]|nr:polysaccharide deacetylase family protein [Phycisphaerae bacterium]
MTTLADIGSHTRTHPILTTCSDEEGLVAGFCLDFCCPDGDYAGGELRLVEQAGYRSARTVEVGWNHARARPFRLRITGVTDDASVSLLASQPSGIIMRLGDLAAGRWGRRSPGDPPGHGLML